MLVAPADVGSRGWATPLIVTTMPPGPTGPLSGMVRVAVATNTRGCPTASVAGTGEVLRVVVAAATVIEPDCWLDGAKPTSGT